MRWITLPSLALMVIVQTGCQNMCGGGYPMQGMTRVPPPGTGSYPMPGTYYNPMGTQSAVTPSGNLPATALAAGPSNGSAVVSAGYTGSSSMANTATAPSANSAITNDPTSGISTAAATYSNVSSSPAQYNQQTVQPASPSLQWTR